MVKNHTTEKIQGAVAGFAIGDSLGFPAAGIRAKDFLEINKGPIKGFSENKYHPLFYKLRRGQYTDNNRLFVLTIESLVSKGSYDEIDIILRLKNWAKLCRESPYFERWPGKTSLTAALKLLNGGAISECGVKKTISCGSIYRALPLGIFLFNKTGDFIVKISERCASYTHNSKVSKLGAAFASLILSKIIGSCKFEESVIDSLSIFKELEGDKISLQLFRKIEWIIYNYKTLSYHNARKVLGTGSSITQTLPLSLLICLKARNFEEGVIAAANSFRDDCEKERERLSQFGWTNQLLECIGGNTDGIAAICGCFLGALFGVENIPQSFKKVEDFKKTQKIALQIC
ncbi:MAG: ADP-ribosylglycohydrolase family protein [Candidatus Curtissbacteria bacterium]|nr:ADP-ribosylglycohydrolase family protein [Candidatus Curtissbacteria bacterium]